MPEQLKTEVLERFTSIHAFCKAHPELSRSTVYQTLSGKYPGNFSHQAAKIRAALSGQQIQEIARPEVSANVISETLQDVRCANCRRLNRRECVACRAQTEREATELYGRLFEK